MLFDSALYLWFLIAVFALSWALIGVPRVRALVLLLASYAFYASWSWRLLFLIAFSTLLDWVVGAAIHRARDKGLRTALLLVSLGSNLGLLGLFKYLGFFTRTLDAVVGVTTGGHVPVLELILPVGISFYTFQTLSYTIDIYRGRLAPTRSLLDFALFVTFFPQLVAGPIVRASELLPQLAKAPRFDPAQHGLGLWMIGLGLVKKVVFADVIAVQLVDAVYKEPQLYSAVETLVSIYGYSLQIYCDFSAYSDIAIGSALLLGYRLPDNFDRPYQSASLQEFWRRWHMSLSFWLRDYLYIPLGGSRRGPVRTYLNLLATMVLGGLWHGASWTFVFWGVLHGGGLAINRMFQRWRERHWPGHTWGWPMRLVWTAVTLHFVIFAFHWFRASSLAVGWEMCTRVVNGGLQAPNLPIVVVVLIGLGYALHLTPRSLERGIGTVFVAMPAPVQAALLVALAVWLQQMKGIGGRPFIYFQF